jgi:DNA-binding transcriptional LysR family regulator
MALTPNKFVSSIVVDMLDVTRLRVLVAVARHGSVTAAARELNYAQPSVSHHLARLEAETGVRLIQRAGRGIRLTDAGRLLADRATEVLGRLDAAENELAAHAGLSAGRVRLAAFPSALGTIVPAAAAKLRAEYPGMDVRLTEAEPPEALRMLRAGYVDVALVFRYAQRPAPVGPDPAGADPVGPDPAGADLAGPDPAEADPAGPDPAEADPAGPDPAEADPAEAARPGPGGLAGTPDTAVTAGMGAGDPFPGAPATARGENGTRGRLVLDEPVHLVTRARNTRDNADGANWAIGAAGAFEPGGPHTADLARYAGRRWIAGCERCRVHLIMQCSLAGFTPKIAFTTDDYVAVQALVAAGLGVATLPDLALRAARHPAIRIAELPGARRHVFALQYGEPPDSPATIRLIDALSSAAATLATAPAAPRGAVPPPATVRTPETVGP